MKVAGFERRVAELYGIGVQVANADDTAFADDTATLMGAAATSSETSGKAQFTSDDLAKKSNENTAPNVQATAAELASARVRVYGKAQNRTALGIAHAYMVMYPHAKLEDLRQAFPNSLNPGREIFAEYKGNAEDSKFGSYFSQPDELLTMGDGTKVQFAMMWTKPDFEKIANHAKQYGILIADFEKADGGAKKGGFRLEYLNGYVPPVPGKKTLKWWVWLLIALFVIGTLQVFYDAITKPTIVEKEVEKVVEVEKIVYVDRVEEIEKNFNSATFIAGKADLSDDAKFVLHDLAQLMEKHPELRLKLVGHTSSEGDPVFNQKLSEARAKAAVDFLVARGIDADRLESEGKGSSEPLDENNPEVNRRTEFIVLE
jgi:outer membrane protein OmpA-like peptidoglycan-associated protein